MSSLIQYTGLTTDANTDPLAIFKDSSGSEKLRITNAGDIGMGITSPSGKLHIRDTTAASTTTLLLEQTQNNSVFAINIKNDAGNHVALECQGSLVSGTVFGVNKTNMVDLLTTANITSLVIGTLGVSPLVLGTNSAERLRIASDGKVGINTASAASLLEVKGKGTSSSTSSFNVTDSAGISLFYVRDDGRVGIKTSTPGAALEVNGQILSKLGTTSAPSYSFPGQTSTGFNSAGSNTLSLVVNGTEAVFIDISGKVGIGTSSPSEMLHVSGNVKLGGYLYPYVLASEPGGQSGYPIYYDSTAKRIKIYIDSAWRKISFDNPPT